MSEYTEVTVCDREKKTDVFLGKGRVYEERMPRLPSCSSPHTLLPHSLHVGSFCMSGSVIPGGQNRLSLSLAKCVSRPFSPYLASCMSVLCLH